MNGNAQLPEVIFLDAVGTLFGIQGSVGGIYGEMARRFGVEVSASELNQAFFKAFKAAGPPAFAETVSAEVGTQEFNWWLEIATDTFKQAGAFDSFPNFGEFFPHLYNHFATADPWFLYPDVYPALERWQGMGVQLGVLSNFDSRLYQVLQALDLAKFFSSITISTEVGAAKPDSRIFAIALQKHHCQPQSAWHIGDSFEEDYQAACSAGMRGIWLRRDG